MSNVIRIMNNVFNFGSIFNFGSMLIWAHQRENEELSLKILLPSSTCQKGSGSMKQSSNHNSTCPY